MHFSFEMATKSSSSSCSCRCRRKVDRFLAGPSWPEPKIDQGFFAMMLVAQESSLLNSCPEFLCKHFEGLLLYSLH